MIHRLIAFSLLFLAIGCGPTRTTGTEKLSPDALAVLTIRDHAANVPGLQFKAVKLEGVQYDVKSSSDFYLTAGDHDIEVGITYDIPGPAALFVPGGNLIVFIPASTGPLVAGKHYQLRQWDKEMNSPMDFITHVAVEVPE